MIIDNFNCLHLFSPPSFQMKWIFFMWRWKRTKSHNRSCVQSTIFVFNMHAVQLSSLSAAAGASHSTCAVSCKPLISSCLFNGTAKLPPTLLRAETQTNTHMDMHTPPPSHLALLPYTQSSQAYHVCPCCCCRANEQCTKTKELAKLLLSDPLWREGKERDTDTERKRGSPRFVKIY